MTNTFTRQLGIRYPVIGGPMYPCSNPELVAAVSEAGGIGVIQPVSLTYVHGYDFREGLRYIRRLTDKPIGLNALIEHSSKKYQDKMRRWIEIALQENVKFYITSLGKPDWVVKLVHAVGGVVYHDATERKWAEKALAAGVDGIIAVNSQAGGHAGRRDAEQLYAELSGLDVPLICAGGVANQSDYQHAMALGYAGVQIGTRFIASTECTADDDYKNAIIDACAKDIVLSERITGIPVAVINSPYIQRTGLKAGMAARWMLQGRKTKHLMRTIYALRSLYQLKKSLHGHGGNATYWQAGKSVEHIHAIKSVDLIVQELVK